MAKAEISWKRKTDDGQKCQVYAHHVGTEWRFYIRERRFDRWEVMPDPPLEDWLALLDGVERRVARRLLRPEETHRIRRSIHERYPNHHMK